MKKPRESFTACVAVRIGAEPATPAPAKAASAIGGVTFDVCESQKMIMCATRRESPRPSSAGAAMTEITM